ncbi:hypothetical protein H9Q69_007024 [Fusarium xylarioides]|nr:hypothetical protein H9Q69_007024 [Fusarium xylarioides]
MTKVPAKATYVLEVDHPEFEGRARFVQNFVDNADLDANGHGTNKYLDRGGVKLESGISMATLHVTGLAAYFLGLKDIKASKICNLIASMSLIDVIKGIPENTVNLLIQNGEAK